MYPGGRIHTYTYDDAGNRTVMADATGVTTSVYDVRNLVRSVTNPDGKTVSYTYTAVGLRRTLIDPDGGVSTYSYDNANRLSTLVNPQGKTTTLTYDLAGRKTQIDHGNGATTVNTYDCGDRLKVTEHRKSDTGIVNLTTYSYDAAGNRTTAQEHDGAVTTWTYDDSYQLTGEQRSGSGGFDVSYSYDAAGNRTLQDDSGALTTYTYNADNRLLSEASAAGLTTYTYDADGNRTQKETSAAVTYYTWDEDSRLTVAEPVAGLVTFTYNADGRRVEKETPSETTRFVYDGNKVLQETDGSGAVEQQYSSTLAEWGELVSGYDGLETSTYHYDAIGTTDALLDESETATDRYRHRAFGLEQSHTGSSDNPFTFVGREGYYRDEELALYLAGARYYDPAAGRWLSEHPIGLRGRDANLYRYVDNNPVNATDPSGLVEFGFLPDPLARTDMHGFGYKFGSTDIELAMEALQLAALHRALQKAKSELDPNKHRDIGYDLEGYRSPWLIIGLMRILEHNREVDQARMNLATLKELNQQFADIEETFGKGPLSTVDFYSPVRPASSLFPDRYPEEPSRPLGIGLKGALAALESGHQIGFVDGPIEQSDFSPVEIAFLGGRLLFSATRSIARILVTRQTVRAGDDIAVAVGRHLDDTTIAPIRGASFFDALATAATRNADSTKLILGKWSPTGTSYQKVAAHYKATYFKFDKWRELSKTLSDAELWKINEAFLRQQIKQGKQIILSHDPSKATGFFKNEVDFLKNFYRFEKDGWVWKAIPK